MVNPYNRNEVAHAIELALSMPLDERLDRWQRMMRPVRTYDIAWWVETFVNRLANHPAPADEAA